MNKIVSRASLIAIASIAAFTYLASINEHDAAAFIGLMGLCFFMISVIAEDSGV